MASIWSQDRFSKVYTFEYIQIILLLHLKLKDLHSHLDYRSQELLYRRRHLHHLRRHSFIAFTLAFNSGIIVFAIVITFIKLDGCYLLKL